MLHLRTKPIFNALIFTALLFWASGLALAHDMTDNEHGNHNDDHQSMDHKHAEAVMVGMLKIESAWVRAVPPVSRSSAAYLKITNNGDHADALIEASATFAKTTELHNVIDEDGLKKMIRVGSISLEPGQTTELKPGGFHIMLNDLADVPKAGEQVNINLVFEKGGEISLPFQVKNQPMPSMKHHHH